MTKIKSYILKLIFCSLVSITLSIKANSTLPDFSNIKNVKQKKQQFFDYLIPMAKKANQKVMQKRKLLLKLENKSILSNQETNFINKLSIIYKVKQNTAKNRINGLLIKVDLIPTSLLLAQAANESAWGTSRFAKLGNNLFGQWCYNKNCGIVPNQRSKGKTHEVRKFNSAYESIEA